MSYPIQYISQGETIEKHIQNIEVVCSVGGKWIQLRLKNVTHKDYLAAAKQCKRICEQHKAKLIINDNVSVAQQSNADGVHLGLEDTTPKVARSVLGIHKIIGGTANSLNDCYQQVNAGVDYLGLGPFRYTTTKKKLAPTLGIRAYQSTISALQKNKQNTPVFAIGGIQLDDLLPLKNTGISGVALSGYLSNISTDELAARFEKMKRIINTQLKEIPCH